MKFSTQTILAFCITVLIVGGSFAMMAKAAHTPAPQPETTATPSSSPTSTPLAIPSDWQAFPSSDFGFTFSYPADWGVDDTTINQYYTLHQAFESYSNELTVYSTQDAESDHTVGPSMSITIASASDTASRIGTSFSSSADWLNKASTGLPPHAVVTNLTIGGLPAVEVSNLSDPFSNYETVYLYDVSHNATVRFDLYYPSSSTSSTLDMIVSSFRFTKKLTEGN